MTARLEVGRTGEGLARWFLEDKGLRIVATNVRVGRGELDLLAVDGSQKVAVEVRTRVGGPDPVDAADNAKRSQASSLAREVGADRFDVVGVRMDLAGMDVHWIPGAF